MSPDPRRHPRRLWGLFLVAVQLLTRLPVPAPSAGLRQAVPFFPIVGALLGLGTGTVALLAAPLGDFPAALLAVAAGTALTGALHEDGLADCCDAFGASGRPDALRILRDSRIGTFGVLGLLFAVGLRILLIASLADPLTVLAIAGATSRFWMVLPAVLLPYARQDGMAAGVAAPRGPTLLAAAALGLLPLLLLPAGFAAALLLPGAAALLATLSAHRRLGGYTGDVLGATQQLAELAVLLAAVWHAA